MNAAPNPVRSLALEPILGGILRVFEIGAYRFTDLGRLYPRSAIFAYHFALATSRSQAVRQFSALDVRWFRVLRSMKSFKFQIFVAGEYKAKVLD
jgi:hypothetical protein